MQRKYLLRKIGKHLCHAVLTIGIISGASSVVSADEVKEQDQTPRVEAVQKEVPKATDEASQKKSTSIDELTQPEKSETAVVRMTAQIERESDNIDVPSVQIGNTADTTEVVKKQNVEAEIDNMISEIANEANSSELKDGNQVYKIDRMLVNKERREVDGRPQYTYSINFHASPDTGLPDEPVVESNVTVKDNNSNTLIHEVKTGTNESPVNYLEDWNKYTVGDIVSVNDKAYHVEEAIKRYAEVRDVQYQHGEAKTYLDVRLREILKTTTETISFRFINTEGSIVRDKIDTEVTAGKAESIFNLGDTIVENGKTYNVANRTLELNKQELPEGTHDDFLYTITLKEVKEEPKVEEVKEEPIVETFKTRVTVMDENGKVIVGEYDPHKESSMPSLEAYEADKSVTLNGKQYTVKRVTLESNTSHEGDKDITTERYNVTVKAADKATQSTFVYNAKTEYEFNDKVIKVGTTGTKFALSRDEADRGLESLTNDIQATVGQTIEVNGVKYKISKVKHIEREVYDRDNGATFLNAQVVFALEEVSQPTASQDNELNQETPVEKQEEPVEKQEEPAEKPIEKQEEPVEKLVEKQETPVEKQDEKQEEPVEKQDEKQDQSKEELKNEQPQEESKEEQKPEVKSDEKPEVKSDAKEESKPEAKPESKSDKKEEAKQQPVVAKDSSETKQLPETGIAGFLELLGLGALFTGIGAASYLKKKK